MLSREKLAELHELSALARELYNRELKSILEPQYEGKGIAIHPASGDYHVAMSPTHAGHALRKKHPEGGVVTMRIGPSPDFALTSRIPAGELLAARSSAALEQSASKEHF